MSAPARGRRAPPCHRLSSRCRFWKSLIWWSWAGLDWGDYLWVEYGQIGRTGP